MKLTKAEWEGVLLRRRLAFLHMLVSSRELRIEVSKELRAKKA